jgi:glycine cleavage system H protein
MVALLVLATFVAFIIVDYILHREKYRLPVAETSPVSKPSPAPVVAGVALPESLSYHLGHTWALHQGQGRIRIGVDEFAASLLGRVHRIQGPPAGRWLRQGEKGWTLATEQGEAAMVAPVEGEIVAVNERVREDPSLITRDPYGAGWLYEVYSPDVEVSLRNLLNGALARRWMEWAVAELRQALAPQAFATALDGGRIQPELGLQLNPERWRELTQRFFLNS